MLDGSIENSFDSRIQTRKDADFFTPIQVRFRENIYQSFFAARVENNGNPFESLSSGKELLWSLLSVRWLDGRMLCLWKIFYLS